MNSLDLTREEKEMLANAVGNLEDTARKILLRKHAESRESGDASPVTDAPSR